MKIINQVNRKDIPGIYNGIFANPAQDVKFRDAQRELYIMLYDGSYSKIKR